MTEQIPRKDAEKFLREGEYHGEFIIKGGLCSSYPGVREYRWQIKITGVYCDLPYYYRKMIRSISAAYLYDIPSTESVFIKLEDNGLKLRTELREFPMIDHDDLFRSILEAMKLTATFVVTFYSAEELYSANLQMALTTERNNSPNKKKCSPKKMDLTKFVETMAEYPCLWKPYHKDYDNEIVLDQSWLNVVKKQLVEEVEPKEMMKEIYKFQSAWSDIVKVCFDINNTEEPTIKDAGSQFDNLEYLKCDLDFNEFVRHGVPELVYRAKSYVRQTKEKIARTTTTDNDAWKSAKPDKTCLEKAVLVDLISKECCLWESTDESFAGCTVEFRRSGKSKENAQGTDIIPSSAHYRNPAMCDTAWHTIAKELSESDDDYYVWKYQRMWQALMQRFLIQYTQDAWICSQYLEIKKFIEHKGMSPKKELAFFKKVHKTSIHFVEKTNQKLAKENKKYELRPEVLEGYEIRVSSIRVKSQKSLVPENKKYCDKMKELLQKR